MSILTDFVKGARAQSFAVIGSESVTIDGGGQVDAILNEVEASADYEPGGYDHGTVLTAVIGLADWEAAYPNDAQTYIRKLGTARGQTMRVQSISEGAFFVEVKFINKEAAQ